MNVLKAYTTKVLINATFKFILNVMDSYSISDLLLHLSCLRFKLRINVLYDVTTFIVIKFFVANLYIGVKQIFYV